MIRMQLVDWSYLLSVGVAIDIDDYPVYYKPNGNIRPSLSGGYIVNREENGWKYRAMILMETDKIIGYAGMISMG